MSKLPKALRDDIRYMLANPGLYIASQSDSPGGLVPIISRHGQLRAVEPAQVLDPTRFCPKAQLSGPVKADPWINVKYGLPPDMMSVLGWVVGGPLVVDDPFVDTVSYDQTRGVWLESLGDTDAIVPVTHWMPLPLPPGTVRINR